MQLCQFTLHTELVRQLQVNLGQFRQCQVTNAHFSGRLDIDIIGSNPAERVNKYHNFLCCLALSHMASIRPTGYHQSELP